MDIDRKGNRQEWILTEVDINRRGHCQKWIQTGVDADTEIRADKKTGVDIKIQTKRVDKDRRG